MNGPAFSSLHRCRVRYVVSESEIEQVRAEIAVHAAGFEPETAPLRIHDVYFGRSAEGDGVESGRDGLSTSLRFRWHGDDPSGALGMLQLEAESSGLSCQVSQRIDASLDLTQITAAELRPALLEHVQGFVRLELARRPEVNLFASVQRGSWRSRCGRLLLTVDREVSAARAVGTAIVGAAQETTDPDLVVVVLQAHQRDVAALQEAASWLSLARSDARTASRARFRLPG
jgi:hypothetical protein